MSEISSGIAHEHRIRIEEARALQGVEFFVVSGGAECAGVKTLLGGDEIFACQGVEMLSEAELCDLMRKGVETEAVGVKK